LVTEQTSQIWPDLNPNIGELAPQVAKILYYRNHPVDFVTEVLGITPEPYQAEVLNAIVHHDRIAVHTGHGVGKTACASWIVIWFTFCWGPCKVVTTAPSWRQVEDLLWAEVHKWIRRARLEERLGWIWPFKLLDTRLEIMQEWYATGEASDEPVKMEGYHAPSVLYVIDEAKAVPELTFEAVEGALTGDNSKCVMISTPGDTIGYFYRACVGEEAGWYVVHVDGETAPRVSRQWIDARRVSWGEDSAVYKQRVRGLFASSEEDTVIASDWIRQAANRLENVPRTGPKVVAVDVGNRGGDESVISFREGHYVHPQVVLRYARTTEVSRAVFTYAVDHGAEVVVIDANGVGAGVYDELVEMQGDGKIPYSVKLIPFMGAGKPSDPRAYINRRAELWWALRQRFYPGMAVIGIPTDKILHDQLLNIKYTVTQKELIQIESKEVMRKKGIPSPDRADSLSLLYASDLPDVEVEVSKYAGHTIGPIRSIRRAA